MSSVNASSGEGSTNSGDISNSLKSSRRSFEFRMSKKVAELTQVVHMLFTRNHEKEVEIEALKEAYELEIADVITDARQRIAALERLQDDWLRQQTVDADRIRNLLEGEFQSREQELKARLEGSVRQLQEERTECQNLRDILIRNQRDIENLRQGASQQQSSLQDELCKRDREIERLKKLVTQLERSLKECNKESSEVIKELQISNDALDKEVRQVHLALEDSHRTREHLLVRNKQLEEDIKNMRRDFNRKVAEVVNNHRISKNGTAVLQDHNEELERLRREIQRYRLELSNREGNFNRMFTEKQPIFVDKAGGAAGLRILASHSAGSLNATVNGASYMSLMKREKTMPHIPPSGSVTGFEEPPSHFGDRQRSVSTSNDRRADGRFPTICSTPDVEARPAQNSASRGDLAKPKPLPKQMLSSK